MAQSCEVPQLRQLLLKTIRTRGSQIVQEALLRSNKRVIDLTCQIATSQELLRAKEADLKLRQTEVNELKKTVQVKNKELKNLVRRIQRISGQISGTYHEEHLGIDVLRKDHETLALEVEELENQIQVLDNFQRHLGIQLMGQNNDGDTVFKFSRIFAQVPGYECYLHIRKIHTTYHFDGAHLQPATKSLNNVLKQRAQATRHLSPFLREVYEILKNSSGDPGEKHETPVSSLASPDNSGKSGPRTKSLPEREI